MNQIKLFFLSILFFSTFSAFSQNLTTLQFQVMTHDFGDIREELGPVSFDFIFTNTGEVPFEVGKVESSCGCTTPAYSTDPVKPGKTGFVRATFDPANVHGNIDKTITVTGNTKQNYYLKIVGTVIPRPKTIEDDFPALLGNLRFKINHVAFGEIKSDQIDTGTISIYNPTSKTITIKNIEGPLFIKYSKLPVYVMPKGQAFVSVIYNAFLKNDFGYQFDRIYLVTDDTLVPKKEIIIVANIIQNTANMTPSQISNLGHIKFDTTVVDFGKIAQDQPATYEFKFTNTGKSVLVIYDVKSECGCTATTLGKDKLEAGESSIIKVVFNPGSYAGYVTKKITVTTNDPDKKTIILEVKASVVPKGTKIK